MDLISIIVPVYKVEPYLDRCVRSIVEQTYTNLEIILVDDGSPDNCGAMCDAWAAKDSRIRVIHKENGGLSDARNAGMAVATGTYMGFVDSDDYIAPEMYRLLYDRINTDSSDIAACGVEMVFEDDTPPRSLTCSGQCLLDRSRAMEAIISETWLKQPVWYKLYKTEQIRDIPFPVGKYHEDVFWSYQAIAKAQMVSVFDTPCYFYTQRSGSIMGGPYSMKRLDALEAKFLRQQFLAEQLPDLTSLGETDLFFSCLYTGQMSLLHLHGEEQEIVFKAIDALRNRYMSDHSDYGLTGMQRLWFCLSRLSFKGTCRLRNALKVGF